MWREVVTLIFDPKYIRHLSATERVILKYSLAVKFLLEIKLALQSV